MSTMSACNAHRLELQTAMLQAELDGDIEAAEEFQRMLDEFDEYMEDFE